MFNAVFNFSVKPLRMFSLFGLGVLGLTALLAAVYLVMAFLTNPPPGIAQSGSNKTFFYRASATVTLPDRGKSVTFNAYQIFEQQYQNPWEWALFFVDPLETDGAASPKCPHP